MQPRYITLTSSGSSPWMLINWQRTSQFAIGVSVSASGSSGYQIDVTMDDPQRVFPNPYITLTSTNPVTIFASSQVGGPAVNTAAATNVIGSITTPITALRLTSNSTGGTITMTVFEPGIG